MSNNKNWQSREIVKTWFDRSQNPPSESYNYFDRFISLWVSFNCYFVAEHYNDVKQPEKLDPSEYDYLKFMCEADSYKEAYQELLADPDFDESLNTMMSVIQTETHFQGMIADMRPGNAARREKASKFTSKDNFKQYIFIIYQVRCNLFHGNKSPYNPGDEKIVESFFKSLSLFCRKIYEKEGYVQ